MFLMIAVTVLWSALTGPIVAQLLGLRRKADAGWVIVGANTLARRIARVLDPTGTECLLIDVWTRRTCVPPRRTGCARSRATPSSRPPWCARSSTRGPEPSRSPGTRT
ncbi:MAG: hypothetical protein M5U28_46575 [Sandaracinaceae bacterium]|nr:hypothetical protein [Sandaracinaceae bacterium]